MKKVIWILTIIINLSQLVNAYEDLVKIEGFKNLKGWKIHEKGYKSYNLTGLRLKSAPGAEVIQKLLNNKYGKFVDLYIEKKKLVRTDLKKVYYKDKLVCEFKNVFYEKDGKDLFKTDECLIDNVGKVLSDYVLKSGRKISVRLTMMYEIKEVVGNISYPFKVENYSSIPRDLSYDEILKKGLSKRYKVYNDELGISFESDLKYVYYNGKKVCEFKKYIQKPHCGENNYGDSDKDFIEYRIYNEKNVLNNSLFGLTGRRDVRHNIGPHVEFFVSFLNKQFENIKKPRNYAVIRTFEGDKVIEGYEMYTPFMEASLKRSQKILNKNSNRKKIKNLVGDLLRCLKLADSNNECTKKYFVNVNFHTYLKFLKRDKSNIDKVLFVKNEVYYYALNFLEGAQKDLDSYVHYNSYGSIYLAANPSKFYIMLHKKPDDVWQVKGYSFPAPPNWAFGQIGTDPI